MQQPQPGSDLHRVGEQRSIAYHRVIAERLLEDPSLLEAARARVRGWMQTQRPVPTYARGWSEILAQDVASIAGFLVDPGDWACELRQSSPFAGYLSPQERWQLWRQTRAATERAG